MALSQLFRLSQICVSSACTFSCSNFLFPFSYQVQWNILKHCVTSCILWITNTWIKIVLRFQCPNLHLNRRLCYCRFSFRICLRTTVSQNWFPVLPLYSLYVSALKKDIFSRSSTNNFSLISFTSYIVNTYCIGPCYTACSICPNELRRIRLRYRVMGGIKGV